jgi:hypothetical protein
MADLVWELETPSDVDLARRAIRGYPDIVEHHILADTDRYVLYIVPHLERALILAGRRHLRDDQLCKDVLRAHQDSFDAIMARARMPAVPGCDLLTSMLLEPQLVDWADFDARTDALGTCR